MPRWHLAKLVPVAGWGPALSLLAVNVTLGTLPVAFVIATSDVIGRAPAAIAGGTGSAAWRALVIDFAIACGFFLGQMLMTAARLPLDEFVARRVDGRIAGRIMRSAMANPDVGVLENQELLDDLAEAGRELEFGFQSPGRACVGLLSLAARYVQLAGFTLVIGYGFSWWAALLILVTTILFRCGQRGGLRRYASAMPAFERLRRRYEYFVALGSESTAAKEIRVFGLIDWLVELYQENYLAWMRPLWIKRRQVYLGPYIYYAISGFLAVAAALVSLGVAAAHRHVPLTDLALVLQSALAGVLLGVFYPEADSQTQMGMNAVEAMLRFERKTALDEQQRRALPPGRAEYIQGRMASRHDISFEKVTFRYPGHPRPVLDGFDLTIEAGKSIALAGLNGAGKTTLVKLLAGLYSPGSGAVRAGGTDIREYSPEAWRRQIAVIFQDYLRYEASLADNIAFGSVEHRGDRQGILLAAHQAGLADVMARLRAGLDTPLARHMAGGTDLSGGQWQRVALARALFALHHGASILVLDEPTASLDVRAEAEFYRDFLSLTRGVTTILISHRFASVRLADRIVVLDNGRVTEDGSHAELMALGGSYAGLFALQASRFAAPDAAAGHPDPAATPAGVAGAGNAGATS